jgi:hypothetical protein
LNEVEIGCQSAIDLLLFHDDEGDAVRQAPALVWTAAVQLEAT